MNLYFRLLWTLIRSTFSRRIHSDETITTRRRVWLNDLDLNMHMNNGRSLTVVDLSIIEFFVKTGFLASALRNKWRPIIGASIVTYRAALRPLQAYDVRFRWLCADANWAYFSFEFVASGRLCVAGIVKGGVLGRDGLVKINQFNAALPELARVGAQQVLDRPLAAAVLAWQTADDALLAQATAPV